jgi:ferredoxin
MTTQGTVTEFDDAAGYGHITDTEGRNVFFHCTQIADDTRTIAVGTAVSFDEIPYLGRYQASDIRPRTAVKEPSYGGTMRLVIDTEKCQGHNRCYALAPELVDVDDMGVAFVIGDGALSAEQEVKAKLLVANCPEYAISIEG